MSLAVKIDAYRRLGLTNLARVGLYRLGLRSGRHPVQKIVAEIGGTEFFGPPTGTVGLTPPDHWATESLLFGWHRAPLTGLPDWHQNPFDGTRAEGGDRPWWTLADFDLAAGDIKTVWEASRMDWAVAMAQRAAAGDPAEVDRLNAWLADWCAANPCYLGVNWKCGQEASLRVLHLALAARLLGQDAAPTADLTRLIAAHLLRIRPTVSYAMAQDNNHGTSEAAALFVGGSLAAAGGDARGTDWMNAGRRLLEDRARRLIDPDGGFSQYSVNYHRLMLDTLAVAELWRRWRGLPAFSAYLTARARSAAQWLYTLVDPLSGDAPNLGPNDGANLLPLTAAAYRDFRPAVQLAMALFAERIAYPVNGPHHDHLTWLGVEEPDQTAAAPVSRHFPDSGYAVLRRAGWTAVLRYPRYRFRPHHCDALHLDLWRDGRNLLRDDGTFSYNARSTTGDPFGGTAAHNTVMFDDREQMPAVGRFLRGRWLDARQVAAGDASAQAGYADGAGADHLRKIEINDAGVRVTDQLAGFRNRAVLRWRLAPGVWTLDGHELRGEGIVLRVTADVPLMRMKVTEGRESRHYFRESPLPVLEVEVATAGSVVTKILCSR